MEMESTTIDVTQSTSRGRSSASILSSIYHGYHCTSDDTLQNSRQNVTSPETWRQEDKYLVRTGKPTS